MEGSNKNTFAHWKETARRFLREKGLYVAALAGLAAAGGGLWLANAPAKEQTPAPTPTPAQVSLSQDQRLEEAKASPTPAAPSPSPSPSPAEETPAPAATSVPKPKKEKASAPVKGTLQWPFAMDELVYSETLGQWMTHSGIDIAAPKGTAVYAVWGGRVDRVYTDDALGVMVELDHGDGRISVYGNLDPDLPVEEGQRLQAGDLVGAVGDTAVAECGAAAHLHYELYVDGKAVDPLEYVLLIEE